jgi:DNA-binding beta-propeller fold protein YncE
VRPAWRDRLTVAARGIGPSALRHRPGLRRRLTAAGVVALIIYIAGHLGGSEVEMPTVRAASERPLRVTPETLGAGAVWSGVALPPIPPVTGNRDTPVASWGKPLPYPIVIADRRNNRLIEIAPDKRIVWEFRSPSLKIYRGNEGVSFSADGRRLSVSEEDNSDVHLLDYETRTLASSYAAAFVDNPDDAHVLADGKIVTADTRSCRVLIVDPATNAITTQWGRAGVCKHDPPRFLNLPNGATPLPNGDILVTEIREAWITRLTRDGTVVWSARAPRVGYPSDAFPTADGRHVIVADFSRPGRVVIFDPASGRVTWEYVEPAGEAMLDHPSLARELPETGDILVADDLRHRVIVIDRQTKAIIWQYGVTDTKGHAPGYLFSPDGFDLDVFRDWKLALSGR